MCASRTTVTCMSNNMHNDDPRPLSAELAQILSMVELPNQRLEAIEVARSLPRRFTVQEAAIAAGISMATMYRVIAADGITVIGRRDPRGQVQPVQGASHRTGPLRRRYRRPGVAGDRAAQLLGRHPVFGRSLT